MPNTPEEARRIRRMHDAGNHDRCHKKQCKGARELVEEYAIETQEADCLRELRERAEAKLEGSDQADYHELSVMDGKVYPYGDDLIRLGEYGLRSLSEQERLAQPLEYYLAVLKNIQEWTPPEPVEEEEPEAEPEARPEPRLNESADWELENAKRDWSKWPVTGMPCGHSIPWCHVPGCRWCEDWAHATEIMIVLADQDPRTYRLKGPYANVRFTEEH